MLRSLIFFLVVVFVLYSCETKQNEESKIQVVYNQFEFNGLVDYDSGYLVVNNNGVAKNYFYFKDSNDVYFSVFNPIYTDSFIVSQGEKGVLQKTRNYQIEGHDFTIYRYYFDDINFFDEEWSAFNNEQYGILITYSDAWATLVTTIVNDNTSQLLCESIINDRSFLQRFFNEQLPPIPPISKTN